MDDMQDAPAGYEHIILFEPCDYRGYIVKRAAKQSGTRPKNTCPAGGLFKKFN